MKARHFLFEYNFKEIDNVSNRVVGHLAIPVQDASISRNFQDRTLFTGSNGWFIKTASTPQIVPSLRTIFIQGKSAQKVSEKFVLTPEQFQNASMVLNEFCSHFRLTKRKGHLLTKIFQDIRK